MLRSTTAASIAFLVDSVMVWIQPLKDIRVEDEVHIGIQSLRVPTLGHEDFAFISELIYEWIQSMVLWRGGGNIQKEVTEGVLLRAVHCLGPLPQSVSCQLR